MSSSRANPFRGLVDVVSEMDRMRQLGRTGHDPATEHSAQTLASAWVPAADIYAIDSDLVIRVELAGVDPADLKLELSERVLTISGERRTEPDRAVTFYTRERDDGPFRRSVILPDDVDEDQYLRDFRSRARRDQDSGCDSFPGHPQPPHPDPGTGGETGRSARPRRPTAITRRQRGPEPAGEGCARHGGHPARPGNPR
ncbi:MAG: Hsp20/alpha crystallin family protein [Actinobacteria bacterium]|nr:Hsp20/alpha crystallin family protein [Actinomycetota bacterium]